MIHSRPLVLASSSPRRQYLMKATGLQFTVAKPEVEEVYPAHLPASEVARYLASLKAAYFRPHPEDRIVVTADTVVILDDTILNKPTDRQDAMDMLSRLAGRTHKVMTGVTITSADKEESFDETTYVTFEELDQRQIEQYIDTFQPFDKAGAYGAQDSLPPGVNPCSAEEIAFLKEIGKLSLVEDSQPASGERIVIIRAIEGSYFNVMGLPVHKVYQRLMRW
jgi:septum formation protein